MSVECRGFESHPRQLIFLRKSDCLGCTVLLCFVCLTLLASFFLPSHLSLNYVHVHVHIQCKHVHVEIIYVVCYYPFPSSPPPPSQAVGSWSERHGHKLEEKHFSMSGEQVVVTAVLGNQPEDWEVERRGDGKVHVFMYIKIMCLYSIYM